MMVRLESAPGAIGPERGLIYQSKLWHPLKDRDPHPAGTGRAYRLQFWDCAIIAASLGSDDAQFVGPDLRPVEHRFFAAMEPSQGPVDSGQVGRTLSVGQYLQFDFGSAGCLFLKVTRDRGRNPRLVVQTQRR